MKKALICGVSGQDGAWLAKYLLELGYEVYGTSRDAQTSSFTNLHKLGIAESVRLLSMAIGDFRSVFQVLSKVKPDEIYNLAGQTSVGLSFEQPVETFHSIIDGTLNLLEVLRLLDWPVKLYNASSSECFGDTGQTPANENRFFHPRSPYAVAKAAAFWAVVNYREAYKLFACSGILFNHESPLRPRRFVTRKIVSAAAQIAQGKNLRLTLGNLNIWRDWGYAPDYVEAMWRMLQQPQAEDFIIATGQSHSLEIFLQKVFARFSLDWRNHVDISEELYRPSDIQYSFADPAKARNVLNWSAHTSFDDLIDILVLAEKNQDN